VSSRSPIALVFALLAVGCPRDPGAAPAREIVPTAIDPSARSARASAPSGSSASGPASSAPAKVADAAAPHALCERTPDAPSTASPDGKLQVFVSVDRAREDETTVGASPHQDLCIVREGGAPRLLLAGRGAPEDAGVESTLTDFDALLLSPDLKTLYFTSAAWVTSAAAHAVDLATGKERFLVDGAIEAVISSGPYKGMLVASHFRLDDQYPVDSPKYRGRMAMWSIVTLDGKTVRRLPEEQGARKKVVEGR